MPSSRRTRRTKTCPALEVEAAVARQDLEVARWRSRSPFQVGGFSHRLWLNLTMVYGRYNELDNYGIHGVYKPTYSWGLMGFINHSYIYHKHSYSFFLGL